MQVNTNFKILSVLSKVGACLPSMVAIIFQAILLKIDLLPISYRDAAGIRRQFQEGLGLRRTSNER